MALPTRTQNEDVLDGRRLVFVGGMHRSGTTPLARTLATHEDISAMAGTGQPRDEGQHVQSVFPAANAFGGAGSFALRPGARLGVVDATLQARTQLARDWSPYWDLDRPVLLEKSPPNLIRTPFLQTLFPGARFVIIVRHPVVVALATRKWSRHTVGHLLENWVAGHEIFVEDARSLERVFILSYENLTAEPAESLGRLFGWLGLDFDPDRHRDDIAALTSSNQTYWSQWQGWRRQGLRRGYTRHLENRLGSRLEALGYSLRHPAPTMPTWKARVPHAEVI